jgi:Uma2 family endonuclease
MAKPQPRPWTLEEFLAWEQTQEDKFELVDGVVFAMAGGTAAHSTIAVNVISALRQKLRGSPCRPYNGDMKVVGEYFSAYPDVSICCSPPRGRETVIREPVVVIEVLSSSTRDRDQGSKRINYQRIETLQHYVLIDAERCWVETMSRDGLGWRSQTLENMDDTVALTAIGVELGTSDIYADVDFEQRLRRG